MLRFDLWLKARNLTLEQWNNNRALVKAFPHIKQLNDSLRELGQVFKR